MGSEGGLAMTNRIQALERFVRPKTILLVSYRRNGTSVGTPVNIAVDGEHAFVRTWDTTWKFRRIRNNPVVEIAPSTWRGQPTGPAIRAHARVLSGSEALRAAHALARKYPVLQGILVPLIHRLRGYRTVHIELTPG
jgi:PPOX class probable F420-dependent enzyme